MKAIITILFVLASAVNSRAQVGASIRAWENAEATFLATNGEDSASTKLTGFVLAAPDTVSRVVWDSARGVYTGYDIAVKPDLRGRTAQVWIEPLSLTPEAVAQQLGPRWNPHWKQLKLPSYYSLSSVKFDSLLLVTLWTDGSSRAVDHVAVREKH
jgi:hypothetical protein